MTTDWKPSASKGLTFCRASLLANIRQFFAQRDVLEVDTPAFSSAGTTDPSMQSFTLQQQYLQTSPEFFMKRLLAAGFGDIYQLCKVFRKGDISKLHNPEFTLLEWYRLGFDYHQLMREVEDLICSLLPEKYQFGDAEFVSYADLFQQYCQLNSVHATLTDYENCALQTDIHLNNKDGMTIEAWQDLLLTHVIEPHLGKGVLTFVYDFPAAKASLAKLSQNNATVAERFELYMEGIEIANGFTELQDEAEQRQRFQHEMIQREQLGLDFVAMDEQLLQALKSGLPQCAGVALGVDRLLMLMLGKKEIQQVLLFPQANA